MPSGTRVLLARVAGTLRQDCGLGAHGLRQHRVAIALSGGPDSVALTWLLHELAARGGPAIAGLIHLNHQLRGAESDEDEAFCRALGGRLDLPVAVASTDVAALARSRRVSLEAAARVARYAFFETAAADLGATLVATGHTLDDQAETVLLRLLRGAGTRGLSGIRVRRGIYVRPLLHCRRADLRACLVARGEAWRDDASNADLTILRNRVRHSLMPVIDALAPAGVRALARVAALAQDDEAALMLAVNKARPAIVLSEDAARGRVELDAAALGLLAPALARRLVRAVAADVASASAPAVTSRHLEAVRRLASTDKPKGHLDLPGLTVLKRGAVLVIDRAVADGSPAAPGSEWPARRLDVPGVALLPEAALAIAARTGPAGAGDWKMPGGAEIAIQAGAVTLPLAVRNRRPGDRFRPLGAPGRRKLQDVLVDRKVPRSQRDRVPVVVDATDRIVWVAGVAVAHDCRVTAPADGVLILKLRTAE